eukprot:scaffold51383_cov65-Phaeocystis_antarctica.AAC.2
MPEADPSFGQPRLISGLEPRRPATRAVLARWSNPNHICLAFHIGFARSRWPGRPRRQSCAGPGGVLIGSLGSMPL